MESESDSIRRMSDEHEKSKAPENEFKFILNELSNDSNSQAPSYKPELKAIKTPTYQLAGKITRAFDKVFTKRKSGKAPLKEVVDLIDDKDTYLFLHYFERWPRKYVQTEGEYIVLKGECRKNFGIPPEEIETLLQKKLIVGKTESAPKVLEEKLHEEPEKAEEIKKEIRKETRDEKQHKKEEQKRLKEEAKEKVLEEKLYRKEIKEKTRKETKEKTREEEQYRKQEQKRIKEEIIKHVCGSVKNAYDYLNKPAVTINFPGYKSAVNSALKSINESAIKPVYSGIESMLEKSNAFFSKKVILRNYHLVLVLPAFLAGMYYLGSQKAVMKNVDYGINSCAKLGSKAIKGIKEVYKITSGEMNEIHTKTNR